jgi:hypothetical protein
VENAVGSGPVAEHISSVLRLVAPPSSFVIVAGDRPGCLVSLLLLGLPVQEAYLPAKYHAYFNASRYCVTSWQSTVTFRGISNVGEKYVYVMSGSVDFLRHLLPTLQGCQRVIVTVDVDQTGTARSVLQQAVRGGHVLCQDFDLVPLVVGNATTGGATDAQHFICFGWELTKCSTLVVEAGLRRTVRHVLDGGVEGHFPSVLKSALPELSNPSRAVLWHNNILRPEGLFPSRTPDVKVYCPSHKLQDRCTIRSLTISEKLQLYQLPLSMDAVLTSLFPNGRLPFADSPYPEVYTSILRQLRGDSVGGGTFVSDLTDESGSHFLEGN